ncbi:MAG: RNA polymerase sigma factor [Saprospiraceae bacterium]
MVIAGLDYLNYAEGALAASAAAENIKAPLQKSMTNTADEHLLTLLQHAQTAERGFRLLMETYQEQLYWVVRRLVGNHDDANDVLQNCFIKVYRSIHTFEGKSKLYTWLYRIATNEAITFLNQKSRKATTSIEAGESPMVHTLEADASVDGDELQVQLQKALAQLPDKQRIVFNMRYFDEMPYEEMSAVLDTSVGALKASYHHAVKKIESYFREAEIGEL